MGLESRAGLPFLKMMSDVNNKVVEWVERRSFCILYFRRSLLIALS